MNLKLLQDYMGALNSLAEIHRKTFKGRDIVIPNCFSEALCRTMLNLHKSSTKDIDATDDNGKTYEIKATSTNSGATSIRKDQNATYLVWVYFDFTTKNVVIRKTNYECVKVLVKKDKTSNDRANIRLSQISKWGNVLTLKMNNIGSKNT